MVKPYGPIRHIACPGGVPAALCSPDATGFVVYLGAVATLDHGAICVACAFYVRARRRGEIISQSFDRRFVPVHTKA